MPVGTFLAANPLGIFALLLVLSVVVPPLLRPLRLPDLVGLLLAGVAIGPHALGWLSSTNETVRLLSDVGVIYLLFIAGLEIDLGEFQRIRARSFRFGLLTFTLPMLAGTALGFAYGYPAVSAVLIGSVLASHTPLGYPIVRSFGAMREECVTVAIGGTIFTDIAALVVLALCVSLGRGQLNAPGVVALLLKVALYAGAVLLVIRRLGRSLIRRSVDNESRLFVAVLLALFLAAVGAELVGVEKIVGAFLAGLAVNGVLPDGRVKEQVVVVGANLFIPLFFIDLGLLLDLPVFVSTMTGSIFAIALILTLITSKGLASWCSGLLYHYDGPQMLTLWSLSLPQVAATLAATFVGFRQGLLDERMLNSVLALMVVTATLGPIMTAMAMTRMATRRARDLSLQDSGQLALVRRALRVLVPIREARSEERLLVLAGRLIDGDAGLQGAVLPLSVVSPRQAEAGRRPDPGVHPGPGRGTPADGEGRCHHRGGGGAQPLPAAGRQRRARRHRPRGPGTGGRSGAAEGGFRAQAGPLAVRRSGGGHLPPGPLPGGDGAAERGSGQLPPPAGAGEGSLRRRPGAVPAGRTAAQCSPGGRRCRHHPPARP